MAGGYYETYLEGVKDLGGMEVQNRRLQQAQSERAMMQQLQARRLEQAMAAQAQRQALAGQNQQRLQGQDDIRNQLGAMSLLLRKQQSDQRAADEKARREAAQARAAIPSDKTLSSFRESSDEIQQAVDTLRLLQGEKVGGVKGDKTATGWEGYVPDTLQTLLTPTRGGVMDKITGGGLQGLMGGESGIRTRAAIAGLSTMKGKERSGATITPQEWTRLAPYLPTEKDNADEARDKLKGFLREYGNLLENKLMTSTHGGKPLPKALGEYVRRSIAGARSLAGGKAGLSPEDINKLDAIYGR